LTRTQADAAPHTRGGGKGGTRKWGEKNELTIVLNGTGGSPGKKGARVKAGNSTRGSKQKKGGGRRGVKTWG